MRSWVLNWVMLLTISTTALAENPSMRIGWEDWLPYQYRDTSGELTGLDIELMNAIAERAGYNLFWHKLAWKKHLWEVAAGSIDIAPGASKTPEREEFAHFSVPYRTEPVSLITVKEASITELNRETLLSLLDSGFTIGYVTGYSYAPWVNELIEAGTPGLKAAKSEEYLSGALLDGIFDGFFADAFSAVANLKEAREQRGGDQLIYTYTLEEADIYMMFSKFAVDTDTVDRFNQTITAMHNDGSIDRIVEGYLQ